MGFFDKFKKKKAPQPIEAPTIVPDPAPIQEPAIPKYSRFGTKLRDGDWYLVYSYHDVPFLRIDQNCYYTGAADIDAAGNLMQDGHLIGGVIDDAKKKMISDFLSRNELVRVLFDGPDTVYLGFYRKVYASLSDCPRDIFKLTKTTAMDTSMEWRRYENLDGTEDRDLFEIVYNDETETYVLMDGAGGEVGELSKSDSKKVLGKSEMSRIYAFATDADYSENGHTVCNIEVVYK